MLSRSYRVVRRQHRRFAFLQHEPVEQVAERAQAQLGGRGCMLLGLQLDPCRHLMRPTAKVLFLECDGKPEKYLRSVLLAVR